MSENTPTADILPFKRPAKAIDATGDLLFPLKVHPNFVGDNEHFCRRVLPQVRMAVIICKKTDREMRTVAENFAKTPELICQFATAMDEACEYFDDLITLMGLACDRLESAMEAKGGMQ